MRVAYKTSSLASIPLGWGLGGYMFYFLLPEVDIMFLSADVPLLA